MLINHLQQKLIKLNFSNQKKNLTFQHLQVNFIIFIVEKKLINTMDKA